MIDRAYDTSIFQTELGGFPGAVYCGIPSRKVCIFSLDWPNCNLNTFPHLVFTLSELQN